MKILTLIKDNNNRGFAFVTDKSGNKLYHGSVKDCKTFIIVIEKQVYDFTKTHLGDVYGRSCKQ